MRKIGILIVTVIMLTALCGCDAIGAFEPNTENLFTTSESETILYEETTENSGESEIHTEEMTGETEVSIEEVINYFCEVVLKTEYSDGVGDATLVQKWTDEIHYRIYGGYVLNE